MSGIVFPVAMIFIAVLVLALWIGSAVITVQKTASDRLAVYGRGSGSREEELSKPFAERTFAPIVLRTGKFLNRFTPVGYLENVQKKLMYAGITGIDASGIVVIKVVGLLVGLLLAFLLRDFGDGLLRLLILLGPPLLGF